MPINFDLNDLQAFRAVVETGSFRKAADTVQITQPALSRRIEKLESALNVKLFERTTRKATISNSALMTISAVGSTRMGNVTIACVPSAAYYFMPQVISTFHQLFPKIRIKVLDASANEVNSAVALGEADFGVSFSGNLAPEVDFEELLQERYVMACRRDHPLALCDSVSWEEMYRHDYISLGITSGNRLASTRPLRDSICETRHVTTMIGLVEAGLGVAAVPSIAMPGGRAIGCP